MVEQENIYELACEAYENSLSGAGWVGAFDEAPEFYEAHTIAIAAAVDAAREQIERETTERVLAEVEKMAASFYDRNQCGEGRAWFDASQELRAFIAKLRGEKP